MSSRRRLTILGRLGRDFKDIFMFVGRGGGVIQNLQISPDIMTLQIPALFTKGGPKRSHSNIAAISPISRGVSYGLSQTKHPKTDGFELLVR